MKAMNLVITVIQVLCSLVLVAIVMLQSGKSAGLSGAISGMADTFLSKNKAKTMDAKLAKATKWVAFVWWIPPWALCATQKGRKKIPVLGGGNFFCLSRAFSRCC